MPAKQQAEKNGKRAEMLVRILYHLCGYRLVQGRYRCHYGEIDLIMARGASIVFIEVKFRKPTNSILGGQDFESILPNAYQHERIRRTAAYFLARHTQSPQSCRIDCVVLMGWFRWYFFKDAFF